MSNSSSYCFNRETEGTRVNLITETTNQQIMDLYSTQNLLLILTILNNNSSTFSNSSLDREVVHSNLLITETSLLLTTILKIVRQEEKETLFRIPSKFSKGQRVQML